MYSILSLYGCNHDTVIRFLESLPNVQEKTVENNILIDTSAPKYSWENPAHVRYSAQVGTVTQLGSLHATPTPTVLRDYIYHVLYTEETAAATNRRDLLTGKYNLKIIKNGRLSKPISIKHDCIIFEYVLDCDSTQKSVVAAAMIDTFNTHVLFEQPNDILIRVNPIDEPRIPEGSMVVIGNCNYQFKERVNMSAYSKEPLCMYDHYVFQSAINKSYTINELY